MIALGKRQAGKFAVQAAMICAAALALCQTAFAQSVSARVEWYGLYTTSSSREIADPNSPTGKRFVVTPVAPSSNSDQIPGRDDVRFGMSYILSSSTRRVSVREVYIFPPGGMPDSVTGNPRYKYEGTAELNTGEPRLMGWSFQSAPPQRIVLGAWKFQVWHNDDLILEKVFTVHSP